MDIIKGVVAREASGWSIAWAILLIVVGVAAIASPAVTSTATVLMIGWIVIFGGVAHLLSAFGAEGFGSGLWKAIVGLAYAALGIAILNHPLWSVATLTLAIGTVFVVEGILVLTAYLFGPEALKSGWALLSGFITLALGAMIWMQWPSSSLYFVGTLVGVNLLFTGAMQLMTSLTARGIQKRVIES
jgi:uncharacterized membrane protein HdeD (DUF308 family)